MIRKVWVAIKTNRVWSLSKILKPTKNSKTLFTAHFSHQVTCHRALSASSQSLKTILTSSWGLNTRFCRSKCPHMCARRSKSALKTSMRIYSWPLETCVADLRDLTLFSKSSSRKLLPRSILLPRVSRSAPWRIYASGPKNRFPSLTLSSCSFASSQLRVVQSSSGIKSAVQAPTPSSL